MSTTKSEDVIILLIALIMSRIAENLCHHFCLFK